MPTIDEPHTVVARAFVDVPISGLYHAYAGYQLSTYAIVTLNGKEVYRKEIGNAPVQEKVQLKQGKRYPVTITYLQDKAKNLSAERRPIPETPALIVS